MMKTLFGLCLALSSIMFVHQTFAAEIEVKMLNKGTNGEAMVFEPAFIKAELGDTLRFVPTDRGHDVQTIKELIPAGATPFKGKVNQVLEVKIEQAGAYVVKCTPHFSMGMVALIVAGEPSQIELDAIRAAKLPKKANERLEAQISQLSQ